MSFTDERDYSEEAANMALMREESDMSGDPDYSDKARNQAAADNLDNSVKTAQLTLNQYNRGLLTGIELIEEITDILHEAMVAGLVRTTEFNTVQDVRYYLESLKPGEPDILAWMG